METISTQEVSETPQDQEVLARFPVRSAPRIQDIERQIRWEHSRVQKAVEAAAEAAKDATLADVGPGMQIMREVLPGLTRAIQALQKEALDKVANHTRGMAAVWWLPIQTLKAEKLAVLALRAALSVRPTDGTMHKPMRTVAMSLAQTIRHQIDYEAWEAKEKEANKEARKNGESRLNLLWLLETHYPTRNVKSWVRWRDKWQIATTTDWDSGLKLQIGDLLLSLLVKEGKGWFEERLIGKRGKTERTLCLSDEAVLAIKDMTTEEGLSRPNRAPMICPPKPWVYTPKQKKED